MGRINDFCMKRFECARPREILYALRRNNAEAHGNAWKMGVAITFNKSD
jgi:hypothetical protein